MINELVIKNRSYRRFMESYSLDEVTLKGLVDNARLSASAANLQPLRYIISSTPEINKKIFSTLRWAGYLKDWDCPEEGERPAGYIVILGDNEHPNYHHYDAGIACQAILLSAVEKGLGGCIFASVNREELRKDLAINDRWEVLLVIALGKPKERVILTNVDDDGDVKYWRDSEGTHYVPKRVLKDVIIQTHC